MTRRLVLVLLSLTLLLTAVPMPGAGAEQARREGWGKGLDYNLARAREAMARGAQRAGKPPAAAAKYMNDRVVVSRHSVEPITLKQPDGSTFQAQGIEITEGGGQETVAGFLITQADNGWWHYGVRRNNGRIRAVDAVVGRNDAPAQSRSTLMPAAFRSQLAEFVENSAQLQDFMNNQAMAEAAAAAEAGEPVVFKIPAIMYEVNNAHPDSGDTTADDFQEGNTAEHFQNQLSGIGTTETGTVTEMYLEQSFGKMVIEIDVYGPYEGAASQVPCMFGTDGAPISGDVLGLGGGGAKGMAAEAVPLSDPDVDYTQYDNNQDGWVDFLTILHSGPDAAATGDPCQVWSHYIGSIAGTPPASHISADGVIIGPVLTIPEIDLQIGVTAHEIMHALGEPDYYGTAGTVGTGDWDLGAGGSWAGIPAQTNPVHFNPVMKINFGWVKPTVLKDTSLDEALRPRAMYPDLIQVPLKVAEDDPNGMCDKAPVGVEHQNNAFYTEDGDCVVEGFLIENVNSTAAKWNDCLFQPADFDRQLYGSGLMVWHWDFTNYESLGNDNTLRPMLDIEEFDRRDSLQDLGTGKTRGQPLDVFWGDPVGISGATQTSPSGAAVPEGHETTVTGPPSAGVSAAPTGVLEWDAADAPDGTGMVVELSWEENFNDWDLYVDRWVDPDGEGPEEGAWEEVDSSATGIPQTSEQVVFLEWTPGDQYRARAYNYASTEQSAQLSVNYSTDTAVLFGPAGTRNNDKEQTGWQFTNIRPNDYNGLAHEAALPRTPIKLDVIKHDDTTVDVSGDFLRRADGSIEPFIADQTTSLATYVYNHGGKRVDNATFSLYDADPAAGGAAVDTQTVDLGPYDRAEVNFDYAPALGRNDLYVVADAAGDMVEGNNIVRTELEAYPGGSDVLIVDNDFGWTFEEDYEAALNSLGVSYDIVEGEPTGLDTDGVPTSNVLDAYDAVIWVTTTASGDQGVLSNDAVDSITSYLDNGGKLWMASTRMAGYLTTREREEDENWVAADWLKGYFGLEIEQNLLNSPGTLTGLGGPVGGARNIDIGYLDGKPYIDYGPIADEADVYGTAAGLFTHEDIPEQDSPRVVATSVEGSDERNGFRTVYGLPISLVQDPAERIRLTEEILDFFSVEGSGAALDDLTVRFNRFQMVQNEDPWRVTVGAEGARVDKVELVHRPYGTSDWRSLELAQADGGLYSGVIPGNQIPNNGLEYFARVTSGGDVVEVDGGSKLPNVATAPYGDYVQDVNADACKKGPGNKGPGGGGRLPDDDNRKPGDGNLQPLDDGPVLPATGMPQGLTFGAALLLAGMAGMSGLRSSRRRK